MLPNLVVILIYRDSLDEMDIEDRAGGSGTAGTAQAVPLFVESTIDSIPYGL